MEDEYLEVSCDCMKCGTIITSRQMKICFKCCVNGLDTHTRKILGLEKPIGKQRIWREFRFFTLSIFMVLPVSYFIAITIGYECELIFLGGFIYSYLYQILMPFFIKILKWE